MCVQSSYVSILYLISSAIPGYNFASTLIKKILAEILKKVHRKKPR